MPQSNDAELTDLYTAVTNVNVENDEPNAGSPPALTFDLQLEAVAGSVIGDSGADYTLRIDCIDETLAERNANMSIDPPQEQQFNADAGNDWVDNGGVFVKQQTENITVDPPAKGHVLRYVATLIGDNGDVVSFIESNKFVLV